MTLPLLQLILVMVPIGAVVTLVLWLFLAPIFIVQHIRYKCVSISMPTALLSP